MTNIFVVHGTYGTPEENWFPWLKTELEKLNSKAYMPKFPTPENQSLENWLKVFDEYKQHLNENSIVVGHSLGPVFLLHVLEKLNKPIKAAFFVSGFLDLLDNPKFDNLNQSFVGKQFDWQKIKQNCSQFFVFHSDNDPYVPLEKSQNIAQNLGVNVSVIKNAGHFNAEAGYSEFDLILEKIKPLL